MVFKVGLAEIDLVTGKYLMDVVHRMVVKRETKEKECSFLTR